LSENNSNRRIIVVGVGNVLFKDEGVGCYAAKMLETNYRFSPEIEIIDGATLGFKLMTYFQEYDDVIILDTVSIEEAPGSLYRLPSDVLLGLGSYRKTAHEVEVVEMLEICSMLDQIANVTIMGIVPEDIESVDIDLTDTLKKHFPAFIAEIVKEIQQLGVTVTAKDNQTFEEILPLFSEAQFSR